MLYMSHSITVETHVRGSSWEAIPDPDKGGSRERWKDLLEERCACAPTAYLSPDGFVAEHDYK
jgi:hypothetical protein